jgi:hypothetical protein
VVEMNKNENQATHSILYDTDKTKNDIFSVQLYIFCTTEQGTFALSHFLAAKTPCFSRVQM